MPKERAKSPPRERMPWEDEQLDAKPPPDYSDAVKDKHRTAHGPQVAWTIRNSKRQGLHGQVGSRKDRSLHSLDKDRLGHSRLGSKEVKGKHRDAVREGNLRAVKPKWH